MKKDDPESRKFVNRQYGVQAFYRYERFFRDKKKALRLFEAIPFLNGGLFENLDKNIGKDNEVRIDCFTNSPKKTEKLKVPDSLFFGNRIPINLSKELGRKKQKKEPEQVVLPNDFDLDDILSKQSIFSDNTSAEKVRSFLITRAVAEAKLLEEMKSYQIDLLILAGFMRNFTPYFIDRINTAPGVQRIMNIHPALLPSFPRVDGYGDTFRYGCKVGGCSVHFVDYGEDSGPIIGQKAFQINEDDTLDSIKKKGLKLEWELYPECVQLFAQGRLKIVKMSYKLKNGKIYQRLVVKTAQPA